jgi:hypothetical protein
MTGTCVVCGKYGDIESHHVARRFVDMTLEVDLCPPCHRVIGGLQDAAGVPSEGPPLGPLDVSRARMLGALDVLTLRSVAFGVAELAEVTATFGQLAGHLLDMVGDPDRAGRFAPDPRRRTPSFSTMPTASAPDNMAAWLGGCVAMLAALAERTPGSEHLADLLGRVVDRPDAVLVAVSRVLEPAGWSTVVALLVRINALTGDLVQAVAAGRPARGIGRELGAAVRRLIALADAMVATLGDALTTEQGPVAAA